MERKTVMIALSGGVDSTVAAALLKREGVRLMAGTLLLSDDGETEAAARAARQLGIEHHVFDERAGFTEHVVRPFGEAYARGETPNPCVWCNLRVKFGLLLERAEALGCTHLATGHYAQVGFDAERGRYVVRKAADRHKDQSYVMYRLGQNQLSKILFPLGGMSKSEVRALSRELGMMNAERPESQDICFVPDGDYAAFLTEKLGMDPLPGNFVTPAGEVIGTHKGMIRYTVGQRRGLGIAAENPLYVLGKDAGSRSVILGGNEALMKRSIELREANWQAFERLDGPIRAEGKIRYSQHQAPATLRPLPDGRVAVEFDQPQRAPAPGQSAVFYDGDTLLGGGIIDGEGRA